MLLLSGYVVLHIWLLAAAGGECKENEENKSVRGISSSLLQRERRVRMSRG